MLISCPECTAEYNVPSHLLTDVGQMLLCARCQHEWLVEIPPSNISGAGYSVGHASPAQTFVSVPDSAIDGALGSTDDNLAARARDYPEGINPHDELFASPDDDEEIPTVRYHRGGIAAAWVLSLLLVGSLGFGAVLWRSQVMAAWPASQRAYLALGLG